MTRSEALKDRCTHSATYRRLAIFVGRRGYDLVLEFIRTNDHLDLNPFAWKVQAALESGDLSKSPDKAAAMEELLQMANFIAKGDLRVHAKEEARQG